MNIATRKEQTPAEPALSRTALKTRGEQCRQPSAGLVLRC